MVVPLKLIGGANNNIGVDRVNSLLYSFTLFTVRRGGNRFLQFLADLSLFLSHESIPI
jgi:hypothetical protein